MNTPRAIGLSVLCLGLAAALAVGYRASRLKSIPAQPPAPEPVVQAPVSAPENNPPAQATPDASPKIDPSALPKNRADLLALLRRKLGQSQSLDEVTDLLAAIAKTDPLLALDVAQTAARTDPERAQLVASVVHVWAGNDAQAAWDWTLQQSHRLDATGETPLISVVLDQVAIKDPMKAVAMAEGALQPGRGLIDITASEIIHTAIDALLKTNHTDIAEKTVEQWARGVEKNDLGNGPFEAVALKLAEASPTVAASWLLSLPASDGRNFALATAAANWAITDPKAALDWANTLPPADGREEAMQRAFNRWVGQDKVTAVQWLGEHEADPATDHMISNFVTDSPLSQSSPQVALEWVDLISDSALRKQSMEQVVRNWAETDLNAATRYVSENKKLSVEEKQRLIQSMQSRSQNRG